MKVDLRKLTPKAALSYAKTVSGKTNDEIANDADLPQQTVEQYFKASGDTYFPSLAKLPALCRALGNTILIDWLKAQTEDITPGVEVKSGNDLLMGVVGIGREFGEVSAAVHEALVDGKCDGQEASLVCGELFDVESSARKLRHGLEKISGRKFVPGKGWVAIFMDADGARQ